MLDNSSSDLRPSLIASITDAVGRVVRPHENGPVHLHEPEFAGREWEYVKSCLDEGWVSSVGKFVDRFERDVARVSGASHAVAVVNGTAALHAALMLIGVKPGDEVLMPTLTFVATANAVAYCSAVPHFVDSELATLGLDPDALERHLERIAEMRDGIAYNRTSGRPIRAVVPVHIFGHPVRMCALNAVAKRWSIAVIEDATEAFGSRFDGKPVGCNGVVGVFSFNGNKIVTTGGGGAIVTNDPVMARRAKHLTTTAKRPHPWAFGHDEIGYNYRMPNLNAALGCAQIEQLDGFIVRKRRLAEAYSKAFAGMAGGSFVREPDGSQSIYWLNAILLDEGNAGQRDVLLQALKDADLHCRPAWTPMHRLPMFRDCPRADVSVAENIEARLINLPSSPRLAPDQA